MEDVRPAISLEAGANGGPEKTKKVIKGHNKQSKKFTIAKMILPKLHSQEGGSLDGKARDKCSPHQGTALLIKGKP